MLGDIHFYWGGDINLLIQLHLYLGIDEMNHFMHVLHGVVIYSLGHKHSFIKHH